MDILYDVYSSIKSAKALWKDLNKKYKAKDAKFIIYIFLDFKIIHSRTVIRQVQEFQLILYGILVEGMYLGESFQVPTIIEKLLLF